MNPSDEQNGHQPPVPVQPPPHSNARFSNGTLTTSGKPKEICRNFFWGTCNKNTQCKYRHELDFEEMKKHLKFCHDYQNPSGCIRDRCTYLHATKDEEKLFRATGQLPRVLAERHANIMSATTVETIPLIASFINEALAGPPPPPPQTLAPAPAPPPLLPMLQLPPPPPPPTQPSTSAQPPMGPVYTASPPQGTSLHFVLNQAPPAPPIPSFDASRPPPPIPSHVLTKNGAIKRSLQSDVDAGANKVRKADDGKVADTHCETCNQRDIRIESCRREVNKLSRDEEYLIVTYKKKIEEYENRKKILRSLVSSGQFRLVEDYIDDAPQLQVDDMLGQLNQSPFISGVSTVPKQFLLQLLDYAIGNTRTFDAAPSPSFRLEEILQTLGSMPRRQNSISHTSPDLLKTYADILRSSQEPERAAAERDADNGFASGKDAAYAAFRPAVPPPPKPYYAAPTAAPSAAPSASSSAAPNAAPYAAPYSTLPAAGYSAFRAEAATPAPAPVQSGGSGAPGVAGGSGASSTPGAAGAPGTSGAASAAGRQCHQYIGRYPPSPYYQ